MFKRRLAVSMCDVSKVFLFAEEEFHKYITAVCGEEECRIELQIDPSIGKARTVSMLDDGWRIDVSGGCGKIIGLNERSLLLGIYRFFVYIGCRFLAPGKEYIPKLQMRELFVKTEEFPKNRYRGVVIEGSSSLEDSLRMIDYAAKNGINSYFIQGFNGYPFFKRYYIEQGFPALNGEHFSYETATRYCSILEEEVKKRGMFLHSVGHGFNLLSIGYEKYGWDRADDTEAEPCREHLAEIGGRRGFFEGVPINTNLCYSNPNVRRVMSEKVVEYAKLHPKTDFLHVWLADGLQNHCECDRCKKKSASDWYIILLNEIDRKLTDQGIKTKIVFLIYTDLLTPPATERIKNEDRFVMMFAPIARSYLYSYEGLDDKVKKEEEKYRSFPRNRSPLFISVETNLVYLKKWQEIFHGDIFTFEYYLMWDCYKDYGMQKLCEVSIRDAHTLSKLGMKGMLSCQVQRSFFPDGFVFYALARAMLDSEADYKTVVWEYYSCYYGRHGVVIAEKMRELSDEKIFEYNRAETLPQDIIAANAFQRAVEKAKELQEYIESLEGENEFEKLNLEELACYIEIIKLQCKVMQEAARGQDVSIRYTREVRPMICSAEKKYKCDLDGMTMDLIFSIQANGGWTPLPKHFEDVTINNSCKKKA